MWVIIFPNVEVAPNKIIYQSVIHESRPRTVSEALPVLAAVDQTEDRRR